MAFSVEHKELLFDMIQWFIESTIPLHMYNDNKMLFYSIQHEAVIISGMPEHSVSSTAEVIW